MSLDKESIFLLQKLDCNCNDCGFMKRDFEEFKKWSDFHEKLQREDFDRKKKLLQIAENASFQFDKSSLLSYGNCDKTGRKVSFIPNTLQLDTQDCFKHRRELV